MTMNAEHCGSDENKEVSIWKIIFFVGGNRGYGGVGMGIMWSGSIQEAEEVLDV